MQENANWIGQENNNAREGNIIAKECKHTVWLFFYHLTSQSFQKQHGTKALGETTLSFPLFNMLFTIK